MPCTETNTTLKKTKLTNDFPVSVFKIGNIPYISSGVRPLYKTIRGLYVSSHKRLSSSSSSVLGASLSFSIAAWLSSVRGAGPGCFAFLGSLSFSRKRASTNNALNPRYASCRHPLAQCPLFAGV